MSVRRKLLPLARLDAALALETRRLRARFPLSLDEFRGLFVSDAQVDALLAEREAPERAALPKRGRHAVMDALAARFSLNDAAVDALVLALAPDLEPAYARVYAYLHDDVRRQKPTADLVRRLFGAGVEASLAPEGPLFGPGLLLPALEDGAPLPLAEFVANPVIGQGLFGAAVARRAGLAFVGSPDASDPGPLARLTPALFAGAAPLVALSGADRPERAAAVAALARALERPMARIDAAEDADAAALARDGLLVARLSGALLLIEGDAAALRQAAPRLRDARAPVFVSTPADPGWRAVLRGLPLLEIAFPAPPTAARRGLWAAALEREGLIAETSAIDEAAERFRLTGRQIETAAASLRLGLCAAPGRTAPVGGHALLAAARRQTAVDLGGLAQRLDATQRFDDLVLPPATLGQLRRLAGAIRHRERVFGVWGFDGGPGVTALFSGGPGVGKSMSAMALAGEAGLDLWRIDLSAVVSKYIGETEKHLDRIFALAREGAAILFFDEADALFGKRSEVKDAHDRYANIEVAFLLQRLEAFEGVAILASNLAGNVDPAFSRRMHFAIDFPLPDAALRERLWRAAIPRAAPLAEDADLAFLARQFALSGGDIRVAALDAAFAAATEGGCIDMARLCKAVSRQLLKKGKTPTASDFRHYHALLAAPEARMAAE